MRLSAILINSFLLLQIFCKDGSCLEIDVRQFSSKILELMNNNLGVKHMQDKFNGQEYSRTELKGKEILDTLTKSLTKKVNIVRQKLLEWKKLIEEDFESTSNPSGDQRDLVRCCSYPYPLKFNYEFESMIDDDGVCEITFMNEDPKSPDFRRLNLEKMKAFTVKAYKDMQNKGFYIYYGQEDGYFLQYPALNYKSVPGCNAFDPRIRPWYIAAATQRSKDAVVLVDVSNNVNKELFKELMLAFLRTLDPRDKIAVIPFAEKAFTNPDACFNSQLVKASPGNLLSLRNFAHSMIDKAADHGPALNYATAFNAAFKRFKIASENPEKIIFLVTSGMNTHSEKNVMKEIVNGNRKFGFQVVISSFVINSVEMNTVRRIFHNNIVEQKCENHNIPECTGIQPSPRSGTLVAVQKELEMRKKFGAFFNFVTDQTQGKIQYSFPYLDYFGHSIVIAMSVPMYYRSKLKGVACVDLVVSELLTDITYFKEGDNTYRFLIEKSGLVYQHPLLPKPLLGLEPTVPVDISLLESAKQFKKIRASMISEGSGFEAMVANRSFSRGDASLEGAIGLKKNYTYFWQPVPLTNFSLAVVIEASNANHFELKDGTQMESPMIYHRIDRMKREPKYSFCRSANHIVLNGKSVTKLPADAFTSPRMYYLAETQDIVQQLMNFFSSSSNFPPKLIASQDNAEKLKKSVSITSSLDAFWKKESSPYVAWRYIATEDGLFRIFPGVQTHPLYDPRSRPWYQRSLIYPDTAVLSTPYFDDTSQSMIITLSHLLQKRQANGTSTNVAVMGLDFSMYHLKKLIFDNIEACRNNEKTYICTVVDKSGLVVYHPDFTEAKRNQQLEGQHITKMLPEVAADLIAKKYLVKKSCIGIHKTNKSSTNPVPHLQYFYVLDVTATIDVQPSALADCPEYKLVPVPKTNVYLLSVRKKCLLHMCCPCPKDGRCRMLYHDHSCHCPCKNFLKCDEMLMALPTDLVCPLPPVNLLLPVKTKEDKEKELKEAKSLQWCQNPKCREIGSWSNCTKIGCQWCFLGSSGELLPSSIQFCGYNQDCPRGQTLPTTQIPPEESAHNAVAIAVPIVVILLLIIIFGGFFLRKKLLSHNELKQQTGQKFGVEHPGYEPEKTEVAVRQSRPNEIAI